MNKLSITAAASILTLAIAAGAFYQVLCSPSAELGAYLGSFAEGLSNGVDHKNIFLNSLKNGFMTVGIIFVCGFARPAVVISMIAAARRCFVSGFTTAALISTNGLRGLAAAAAAALPFMLTLIPLAMLCSFSAAMSFCRDRRAEQKTYILLTLSVILIFILASICESYAVPFLLLKILR